MQEPLLWKCALSSNYSTGKTCLQTNLPLSFILEVSKSLFINPKTSSLSYHSFKHILHLSFTLSTVSLEAAAWAPAVTVVNSEQHCSVCLVIRDCAAHTRATGMAILMNCSWQMPCSKGWKTSFSNFLTLPFVPVLQLCCCLCQSLHGCAFSRFCSCVPQCPRWVVLLYLNEMFIGIVLCCCCLIPSWARAETEVRALAEGLAKGSRKIVKATINCSSLWRVSGGCPLLSAAAISRKHDSRQKSSVILNSFVLAISRSLSQIDQGKHAEIWRVEVQRNQRCCTFTEVQIAFKIPGVSWPILCLCTFLSVNSDYMTWVKKKNNCGKTFQNGILIILSVKIALCYETYVDFLMWTCWFSTKMSGFKIAEWN